MENVSHTTATGPENGGRALWHVTSQCCDARMVVALMGLPWCTVHAA